MPDLIGIEDRHYLDATGLIHHRNIGDLMRYAAMNQDADTLSRYEHFVPLSAMPLVLGRMPEDPAKMDNGRSVRRRAIHLEARSQNTAQALHHDEARAFQTALESFGSRRPK